jgi:serpin B
MKKWIFLTCIAVLFSNLAAISIPAKMIQTVKPAASKASIGNNRFAIELLQQLDMANPKENIIYSPFSVSTTLGMTYAGSRGNTEKEMASALYFDADQVQFHRSFSTLLTNLEAKDKPYVLHLANALWVQKDYPLQPAFVSLIDQYYQGSFHQVDFIRQTDAARQEINQWVEKKTVQEIKDLIQKNDLSQNTRLVLTNAIYFKGLWKTPFEVNATEKASFTVHLDKKVIVDMMNQNGNFAFAKDQHASLIELPYAGEDMSLLILLPHIGTDTTKNSVSSQQIQTLLSQAQIRKVDIYLPKFKIAARYCLEQENYLPALGMKDAFSPMAADFSGLTGAKGLYISHVIHQAMLEVDEAGSKAAAATAVIMNTKSVMQPEVFRADSPFIVVLLHKPTNTILFLGKVNDPSK